MQAKDEMETGVGKYKVEAKAKKMKEEEDSLDTHDSAGNEISCGRNGLFNDV